MLFDNEQTNSLRRSRKELAERLLNYSTGELSSVFTGELGHRYKEVVNSGIKVEQLTNEEKSFIANLSAQLSMGSHAPKYCQNLLAAMLFCRADQLPLEPDLESIPNWLIGHYLGFILEYPGIFQRKGEADNYYVYMQKWVDYLHTNIIYNKDTLFWQDVARYFTKSANFMPLYFNDFCLKDIYKKRADIIEFTLKNNGAEIDYIFPVRSKDRKKIRLGILAKHFVSAPETFATIPCFEHLDRKRFEVILYATHLEGNELENYCRSRSDKMVLLPKNLHEQACCIRGDELDVLLISTNLTTKTNIICALAIHRLARVQATTFNSPVTTGIRHIDYYITGKLTESLPEGKKQYSEELKTLDGTGFCFSYTIEPYRTSVKIDRKVLKIHQDSTVYISCANIYKLTPEITEAWMKILASAPDSYLVMMPFGPNWGREYSAKAFLCRMQYILSKHKINNDRLRILDALPNRADVKEVLKNADIYLDSYPYSGTTSLVDAIEVGLPIVIKEGVSLRSRMGASILRSIALNDLITNSEDAYIKLAVKLASRPSLCRYYRNYILQKIKGTPDFLNSHQYSNLMGEMLAELHEGGQ